MILTKKKQKALLMDLGRLLAIQNDYILKEDADDVVNLYSDIATIIDKKHGVDNLMDYAQNAFSLRHPDYNPNHSAEESSDIIGGKRDES